MGLSLEIIVIGKLFVYGLNKHILFCNISVRCLEQSCLVFDVLCICKSIGGLTIRWNGPVMLRGFSKKLYDGMLGGQEMGRAPAPKLEAVKQHG